jgi:AraC family L-rhamnose operon regulatory protein RhaS
VLVVGGQSRWRAGNKQIPVANDSLLHVPAGLPHCQQDFPNDPVVQCAIHYRPSVLPGFLEAELLKQGLMHWNLSTYAPPLARAIRSDFQEMLFEQCDQRHGWEWVLCSRLVELAVRSLRILGRDEHGQRAIFIKGVDSAERVARYAQQLRTQFYLQHSLNDAAMSTGLSRRQFTEIFRKVTGGSWKQYLHQLRLEHSRKLLLQTSKAVAAAAFESGFEDISYFHHAFKKAYGCAPKAIRSRVAFPENRAMTPEYPSRLSETPRQKCLQ